MQRLPSDSFRRPVSYRLARPQFCGRRSWRALALLIGLVAVSVSLVSCSRPDPDLITPRIDPAAVMKGRDLAQGLAACGFCHGQTPDPQSPLAGGQIMTDKYGELTAPNITASSSGIGTWTTNELVRAIRSGIGKEDTVLSPEVHRGYEWMADEDVLSIVSYLRSLPPLDNEVPRRSLGMVERNTTGFFDRELQVRGYIPKIQPRFEIAYGEYLVTRVARCQGCHNSPSSLLEEEEFLAGGKTFRNSAGERIAPGISASEISGIGSWSEDQIVRYLKTGETPEGGIIDPAFCPVGFYRNASQSDMKAIAHFLKAVRP